MLFIKLTTRLQQFHNIKSELRTISFFLQSNSSSRTSRNHDEIMIQSLHIMSIAYKHDIYNHHQTLETTNQHLKAAQHSTTQKKPQKKNKGYLDMLGPDIRSVTGRNLVDDMDRHHPLFTFPRRHLHLLLINPTNPFFFFFLIVFFVFNYSGDGRTTGDRRSNGERGGAINTRGCG